MTRDQKTNRQKSKKGKKILIFAAALLVVIAAVTVFAVANIPKDVTILDGTTSLKVTTNEKDPKKIIEANGFTLGDYDVLDDSQFTKENAVLIIKREMSIVFSEGGKDGWKVTLPARTVQDVLQYLGKELAEGDVVEPAAYEIIKDGDRVTLYKAGDGTIAEKKKKIAIKTSNKTVKQLLAANNITLGKEDKVKPGLKKVLADGETIVITRVTYKEETVKEKVAFKTQTKKDSSLAKGSKKVVREGKAGVAEVTYRVRYEDGKAVKKEAVSKTVIKAAVDKVVAVGTKSKAAATSGDSGLGFSYTKKYEGIASAYYEPPGSMTASGMTVGVGRIGVNPNVIPYGTKLYVTGYGYCVAADCGWGTTGMGRIADLYMNSEEECEAWGIRNVTMYVLAE